MQSVTVLGSTGSIGQSTLDVIAQHPDRFHIHALTAHRNIATVFRQCLQFKPTFAALRDAELALQLKIKLQAAAVKTEVVFGADAIAQLAGDAQADIVVAGIVGAAGLLPTLSAVKAGKRVLLANKEALVMAADIFMQSVRKYKATLLPIDSEHNAIFQCLPDHFLPGRAPLQGVHSIVLTASGGPFRTMPLQALADVSPAEAMAHPNWKMGPKISIDSATMMNKGLEVIEAFWLFGLSIEQIQVVIHPQSVIHSMVSFHDASVLAQLGCPDMRIPITHALSYPERITSGAKRLNLVEVGRLDFHQVDIQRFPCVRLAYQALKAGGTATAILNAANEVAVDAFCHQHIRFTQIATVIDAVMQKSNIQVGSDLDVVIEADKIARQQTTQMVKDAVYSVRK